MVSVLLLTFNAGEAINSLLTSIKNQTVKCELVVIDSSSTDGTHEAAVSHGARVIPIDRSVFNHGKTRNYGVQNSCGDTIVFITQDALLCNEYCIENLIKPLEDKTVAATHGRQIPKVNAKPTERFARLFNYPEKPAIRGLEHVPELGIKTFFFSNVFSAIRRHEFEMVGGFPENLIMFEDMIFAAKLMLKGYKIAYAPEAIVIHSHDYSWTEQFRRYFQAGISFKKNLWFMKYARSENEGIKFLTEEVKYLWKNNYYIWIIYAMIEAFFKYSGYKLGLNYNWMPYLRKKY